MESDIVIARRGRTSRVARIAVTTAGTLVTLALAGCSREGPSAARVTIPPGATMGVAADSLAAKGVISAPRIFRLYAKLRRSDRAIKPGTYMLRRNAGWNGVLAALRDGKGLMFSVTIPEGYSIQQIARSMVTRLELPAESVHAAVRDTALLRRLDLPTETVEGYLFPDTYAFLPGTSARVAVSTMVRRFEQVWEPAWTARLDSLKLSRHDVMTLASIVEKEARLAAERPVIAAVYLNRIREGMLLQADPTVQYALGEHQTRLMYRHLTVDSPYNTYRYPGLPPGPIASPGRASIVASLYPASVPYRFFVAFPDGHHEFRVDLAGHNRAVAEARRAWSAYEAQRRGGGAVPAAGDSGRRAGATQRPGTSPRP